MSSRPVSARFRSVPAARVVFSRLFANTIKSLAVGLVIPETSEPVMLLFAALTESTNTIPFARSAGPEGLRTAM